jgi:hypothetical protein
MSDSIRQAKKDRQAKKEESSLEKIRFCVVLFFGNMAAPGFSSPSL